MNTDLNFYYSGVAETAPKLHNSAGESKLRLHLFGDKVDDRFAVAAEKCDQTKLNWLEKKFYVLVPDPETAGATFYKVNKNSLKKRFQITDKELKPLVQKEGTTDQALLELISKKHADRLAWIQKSEEHYALNEKPAHSYSLIVDALVEAGIDQEKYHGIVFWTPGLQHWCFTSDGESSYIIEDSISENPYNLRNYQKGEILMFICYPIGHPSGMINWYHSAEKSNFMDAMIRKEALKDRYDDVHSFITDENSPLAIINLDKECMKKILVNGSLPSHILKQLNNRI